MLSFHSSKTNISNFLRLKIIDTCEVAKIPSNDYQKFYGNYLNFLIL